MDTPDAEGAQLSDIGAWMMHRPVVVPFPWGWLSNRSRWTALRPLGHGIETRSNVGGCRADDDVRLHAVDVGGVAIGAQSQHRGDLMCQT